MPRPEVQVHGRLEDLLPTRDNCEHVVPRTVMSTCTLAKLHIGTAARASGGFAVALESGSSPITMLPQSQLAVKCFCKPLGQALFAGYGTLSLALGHQPGPTAAPGCPSSLRHCLRPPSSFAPSASTIFPSWIAQNQVRLCSFSAFVTTGRYV
jgi:hypothetical protein